MMGGGAFILLKVGRIGPESAEHAEIRLANLLKILRISGSGGRRPFQNEEKAGGRIDFRKIWII
jgi:hypothetical protein